VCVAYRLHGETLTEPPLFRDAYAEIEPVYEEMGGWRESTVGVTQLDKLPANARRYLTRMEELLEMPLDLISTGPDREQNIIQRHPFGHSH